MILQAIYIYPIKGLGGISLTTSKLAMKGLPYDRRWMLVDEQGRFLSQREDSRLALFQVTINETFLEVRYQEDVLSIPLIPDTTTPRYRNTQIWGDEVQAIDLGNPYAEWFQEKLERPCSLVYFPEENARQIDPDYAPPGMHTSLSDGFPYLLITQESLDMLNEKLEVPISMDRFRPNFVVSGAWPHAEDGWKHFRIGGQSFKGVKPCARCIVTTIDQQTGEKGKEPLATLSTYRKTGNKILFGMNVLWIPGKDADSVEIAIGQEVVIPF